MKKTIFLIAAALVAASCVPGHKTPSDSGRDRSETVHKGASKPAVKPFPTVNVPAIYADPQERIGFMLDHYWDNWFKEGGVTDSVTILGVRKVDVEQAFANYTAVLDGAPLKDAQKSLSALFRKLEAEQKNNPDKHTYLQFTEILSRYLYDPNSPLRNEDYYLPVVAAMAESPWTREEMRPAYNYEAKTCAMNRYGSIAPDFKFRTLEGKVLSLHGVKADYTMLFFSNPYCEACKGIINDVMSRRYMNDYIAQGRVAVVNVYIDEEVDKWREYAPNYPSNWHSGYDYLFRVRNDELYCVRAIPSLYLLDSDKKVIMKDAPTEKVLNFLDTL